MCNHKCSGRCSGHAPVIQEYLPRTNYPFWVEVAEGTIAVIVTVCIVIVMSVVILSL